MPVAKGRGRKRQRSITTLVASSDRHRSSVRRRNSGHRHHRQSHAQKMPGLQDPFPGDPQRAWQRRANRVRIALLHLVLESRHASLLGLLAHLGLFSSPLCYSHAIIACCHEDFPRSRGPSSTVVTYKLLAGHAAFIAGPSALYWRRSCVIGVFGPFAPEQFRS